MRIPHFMMTLFIITLSFQCVASVTHTKFSNVIVFGDSLSDAGNPYSNSPQWKDVGNNFWVKSQDKIGAPITNQDEKNGLHLLWINYFIDYFFPKQTIYPASRIKASQVNPYYHNISYAWASAETGTQYINDAIDGVFRPYNDALCQTHGPGLIDEENACVPGVRKQIQQYLADVKDRPNPNSLFIIWAGGNDIFNNIAKLLMSGEEIDNPAQFVEKVINTFSQTKPSNLNFSNPIDNLVAAKDELLKAGIKPQQIYIVDMPDLSTSPAGKKFANDNEVMKNALQLITQEFNLQLKLALSFNVHNEHNLPGTHIFSAYELLKETLYNPKAHGFINVIDSCVDSDAAPYCVGYLFYNDKHPTNQYGKYSAEKFAAFVEKK